MAFVVPAAVGPSAVSAPTREARPGLRAGLGSKTLRVGLVGCGAFARFSMARYRQLPNVRIAAVADTHPAKVGRARTRRGHR